MTSIGPIPRFKRHTFSTELTEFPTFENRSNPVLFNNKQKERNRKDTYKVLKKTNEIIDKFAKEHAEELEILNR